MRTCLASAALFSRGMAMKISAVIALLTVGAARGLCPTERSGRRGLAEVARSFSSQFFQWGHRRTQVVADWNSFLSVRSRVWHGDFYAPQEPAGSSVDARDLGTHL